MKEHFKSLHLEIGLPNLKIEKDDLDENGYNELKEIIDNYQDKNNQK